MKNAENKKETKEASIISYEELAMNGKELSNGVIYTEKG